MSEIDLLDNMVEEYGMNVMLCTHVSRHTPKGQNGSDVLLSTFEQFVIRGAANKEHGMSYDTLYTWGPVECRRFYQENMLDTEGLLKHIYFKEIEKNPLLDSMLSGLHDYVKSVFLYRFKEGYALLDYRSRVSRFLQREIEGYTTKGMKIIESIEQAQSGLNRLQGENETFQRSSVPSPRLKRLVDHVVSNLTIVDMVEMGLTDDED